MAAHAQLDRLTIDNDANQIRRIQGNCGPVCATLFAFFGVRALSQRHCPRCIITAPDMRHTLRFLRRRDMPQSAIFMLLLLGGTRSIPGEGFTRRPPIARCVKKKCTHRPRFPAPTHATIIITRLCAWRGHPAPRRITAVAETRLGALRGGGTSGRFLQGESSVFSTNPFAFFCLRRHSSTDSSSFLPRASCSIF